MRSMHLFIILSLIILLLCGWFKYANYRDNSFLKEGQIIEEVHTYEIK